jgi:predicted transcriptional regulator of viral defense system
MKTKGNHGAAQLFQDHPVLTLDLWERELGGANARARAVEQAKYYTEVGRLRRLTRGLYAVAPIGSQASKFRPDPYLVAAALRPDAILSHHSALDLLGHAHSVFHLFPYFTARLRRTLRIDGMEWPAVPHPKALVRKRRVGFGVVSIDRRGEVVRVTGPERTLVDGFAAPWWVGGLEELVESAAGFRDLDLDVLDKYLKLIDRRILDAATGWFLEQHPEVSTGVDRFLANLEKRRPQQPLYLGGRRIGGRLQARWNILVPPHLAKTSFEGSAG